MQKKSIKIIGVLLAFIMITALVPITAFAEEETYAGTCKVSINSYVLEVPYGATAAVTWQFKEVDEYYAGWEMLVNGESAYGKGENETVGGFTISGTPWRPQNALINAGRPNELSFSPTKEQCEAGETVALDIVRTPLTEEECAYTIHLIFKDDNSEIGQIPMHTSQAYGTYTENAFSHSYIKSYVTKNFNGYRVYAGRVGSVDKQPFTVKMGENGCEPKDLNIFVDVDHGTITPMHVQPVSFVNEGKEVYNTKVPCNSYLNRYTPTKMDMSEAANTLKSMGYLLNTETEYTVNCDNYTHDPEVSVIEVEKCTHEKTETIDKKEPTCTENGFTGNEICTVCGMIVKNGEEIPALGHKTEIQNKKEATCTEDGYSGDEICTVCNQIIKNGEIIPGGHMTELKDQKDSTCTDDGYTGDEVCTVCNEIIKNGEKIPASGHKFGSWTDTGNGKTHERSCEACNASEKAPHNWNSGVITKQPTDKEKGVMTYTCNDCGAVKTEKISKDSKPKTADESNVIFWCSLFACSGAGVAFIIGRKKKFDC